VRYKADEQTLTGIYYGREPVTLYQLRPPYLEVEPGAGLRGTWARTLHADDAAAVLESLGKRLTELRPGRVPRAN
jgi:hypothetical protein